MVEKITSIERVFQWKYVRPVDERHKNPIVAKLMDEDEYEGFRVRTTTDEIVIAVSSIVDCSEEYGALASDDNFDDFVGAEVLSVEITDKELRSYNIPEDFDGGAMFVTIVTSVGPLQFAVYNAHNGWYGHEAVIVSRSGRVRDSKVL